MSDDDFKDTQTTTNLFDSRQMMEIMMVINVSKEAKLAIVNLLRLDKHRMTCHEGLNSVLHKSEYRVEVNHDKNFATLTPNIES